MTATFARLRYVCAGFIVIAIATSAPAYLRAQRGAGGVPGLNDRVASLEAAVAQLNAALAAGTAARQAADAALQDAIDALSTGSTVPPVLTALANYVTIDPHTINGLSGPHIIFTGANVHIRNGQGGTYFGTNGVGNLIVGYNSIVVGTETRSGSHNVVIGDAHSYPSMGGFVAGFGNGALGIATSVSGGEFNTAVQQMSSVGGGTGNSAAAMDSTVSGGLNRSTTLQFQWVAGGLSQPQ
jgi:hypothetical protein